MSAVSDRTLKGDLGKNKALHKTKRQDSEDRRSCKRDSRNTIADDETVTDWIPEIPFFWNVSYIYDTFAAWLPIFLIYRSNIFNLDE